MATLFWKPVTKTAIDSHQRQRQAGVGRKSTTKVNKIGRQIVKSANQYSSTHMANCRSQSRSGSQSVKAKATSATMTACYQSQAKSLQTLLDIPAHMDLCQIELIYRAEGNANLVLALPQFKKVLRLPKIQTNKEEVASTAAAAHLSAGGDNNCSNASASTSASSTAAHDLADEVGVVTMQDFMAYIEIIRRLLGNEFVCGADIVAIPKASDRIWINEHIKAARPIARLDKEFCGQFGLLLADATQLPATFDVLLSNLQATKIGDTYAIEIKPKQGWRLQPSDVNDLFDLMPTMTTMTTASNVDSIKARAGKRKWAGEEALSISGTQSIQTEATAAAASVSTTGTTKHLSSAKVPSSTGMGTGTGTNCMCRYCSMQVLKLSVGKINKVSAYCPMDLFSGLPDQMLHAMDALFVCPQNNLRIFQNGNLIYGDHAKSISWMELNSTIFQGDTMVLIKDLLVTCLLREYDDDDGDIDVVSETEGTTAPATITSNASTVTITNVLETKTTKVDVYGDGGEVGKTAAETEANIAKEIVVVVKAVIGQPSETTTTTTSANVAMPVEAASQRITTATAADTWKKETITTATPTPTEGAGAGASMTKKQTEAKTEAEALVTQAQINKAEILCLPKNCVLQKILHFQLLAKENFDFMWKSGYATKSAKSYNALRSLLTQSPDVELSLQSLKPTEQYMLGATALDSSIMVTFQEIKMPNNNQRDAAASVNIDKGMGSLVYLSAYDKYYLTKVTLLDLDPKPDSHFHKYINQTKEILNCLNLS